MGEEMDSMGRKVAMDPKQMAEADLIEAIHVSDDTLALKLESTAVRQTDNGWQEGDPLDQPDNAVEPWNDDDDDDV